MTENLNQTIIQLVQKELSDYRPKQLTTVLNLLNEGNTVPFYRALPKRNDWKS